MLEYDENFEKLFNALEPRKLESQKIFFAARLLVLFDFKLFFSWNGYNFIWGYIYLKNQVKMVVL